MHPLFFSVVQVLEHIRKQWEAPFLKIAGYRDSLTRFAHMFLVSIDRAHFATPYW
jgi:hypothetical protein